MLLREDCLKFARVEAILLPHEMKRKEQFIELMMEMAESVLYGDLRAPSPLEWMTARSMAALVWRFDRETSDADAVRKLVSEAPSYSIARADGFREMDSSNRMKRLCIQGVLDSLELLEGIRGGFRQEAEKVHKAQRGPTVLTIPLKR